MITAIVRCLFIAAVTLAFFPAYGQGKAADSQWQTEFSISSCKLSTTGRNDYFILEAGFQTIFEGGGTRLQITVLNETKTVDGVLTRVVEEREWKKGQLYEVSRN